MALMKKTFKAANQKDYAGPSRLIEVIDYDEANNEIKARLLDEDREVTVAFAERDKAGKFARPEVQHFLGNIKKPRDMTAPPGSIIKIDRVVDQGDKLVTAWATVWSRDPNMEMVFRGLSSISFLGEKDGMRSDGTKGYKGLLSVVYSEEYSDYSKDNTVSNMVWNHVVPYLAKNDATAQKAALAMLQRGLGAGIRMRHGEELGSHCIFNKGQGDPAAAVSEFFDNIVDEVREKIGAETVLEVIPVASLPIGNDTAAALFTGENADGKDDASAKAIRSRFQTEVTTKNGPRNVPSYVPALVMTRLRHTRAEKPVPYLSVEGLHPFWVKDPAPGLSNAILAAKTASSDLFQLATPDNEAQNDQAPAQPASQQAPQQEQTPRAAPEESRVQTAPTQQPAAVATPTREPEPAQAAGDLSVNDIFGDDDDQVFGSAADEPFDVASIFGDMDDDEPVSAQRPSM